MTNTTEGEVAGTYAEYLLLLSKTARENPANTLQTRMNAALDADEIARQAIRRLDSFAEAVGAQDAQLIAEGEISNPSIEGTTCGLFLDDLKVALAVIHSRAGYGR